MFSRVGLSRNSYHKDKIINNSDFYHFIQTEILVRLQPIDKYYERVLIINDTRLPRLQKKFSATNKLTYLTPEQIDNFSQEPKFDLVILPFFLHWINDVENFLHQISMLLTEYGIFVANFAGAGTLRALRTTIINQEATANLPHKPHISPFIQFEQVNPLLRQAGFIENIIDREELQLEFSSPLALMQALRKAGQANALAGTISYSLGKQIYHNLAIQNLDKFVDQINLISFIASKNKHNIGFKNA